MIKIHQWYLQERYLSEYNYDEPIDEDRAKNLLNFGDDYRNFIDSLSESYSSISSLSLDRRQKKSKRLRKRTVTQRPEEAGLHPDTQSEAEGEAGLLGAVLGDSEREMARVASSLDTCTTSGGFVSPDCRTQYVSITE